MPFWENDCLTFISSILRVLPAVLGSMYAGLMSQASPLVDRLGNGFGQPLKLREMTFVNARRRTLVFSAQMSRSSSSDCMLGPVAHQFG